MTDQYFHWVLFGETAAKGQWSYVLHLNYLTVPGLKKNKLSLQQNMQATF